MKKPGKWIKQQHRNALASGATMSLKQFAKDRQVFKNNKDHWLWVKV
jgi:hypothetical protein